MFQGPPGTVQHSMIESGDAPYVTANDTEAAYRRKQQVDGS